MIDGVVFTRGTGSQVTDRLLRSVFSTWLKTPWFKFRVVSDGKVSIFDSYDDALATALTSYPDFIRFYDSATDLREEMAKIIVNKSGINFFYIIIRLIYNIHAKPNKLPVLIVNDKKYCNLGQMMGFYFRDQFQFIYVEDHNELVRAVGANYTLGVVNKKLLKI